MTQLIKSPNSVLEELVAQRSHEIKVLRQSEAEQLKHLEEKGQTQLQAFTAMLAEENATLFQKLDFDRGQQAPKLETEIQDIKAKLSAIAPIDIAAASPTLDAGLILPLTTWTLRPYYATVYGSDGSVYWKGYDPGNLDISDWASGSGTGLFGTGAGSFTVSIDWWFVFRPDTNRFYGFNIYVPYHGYYIVRADDGFFTSKEAKVRIDLGAIGYQYNYKVGSNTNVFDVSGDNIDVNSRLDGWRTMYYSTLFGGGDSAYLRVTTSNYVYARGGGSYAELNFAAGDANYIGVPIVYVS
jgi:hypothetical protein